MECTVIAEVKSHGTFEKETWAFRLLAIYHLAKPSTQIFNFAYILLTISTILAEDSYRRSTKPSKNIANEFSNKSIAKTVESDIESERLSPKLRKIPQILQSESNDQNGSRGRKSGKRNTRADNRAAAESYRRGGPFLGSDEVPDNEEETFEELENDFRVDDMGNDVRDHELYHGQPRRHRKRKHKHKRRRYQEPPRYPPIDRDTLYEVGLLIYTRDFQQDMII
ncbi:unnamed protein product [Medioppia subpectinata]|uniref:Uncharacterized protein n=1 Tax=Medioppia subpectinata TaxID=1979941 RepID=A0A7R9KD22_9ACAR|nr:unnamed protein product [Medioppia subpectinata]CAG2101266.1 unnamed protein product [Medioppia subpectinata]